MCMPEIEIFPTGNFFELNEVLFSWYTMFPDRRNTEVIIYKEFKVDIFYSLQPSNRKIEPQLVIDWGKIQHNFTFGKQK